MNYRKHKYIISIILFLSMWLTACNSGNVGEGKDTDSPVLTLTSLNSGEEVVGTYAITWDNVEPNRSMVDIELSTDSGASFPYTVALRTPDTGSYSWDSNITPDCRNCRIRITASDIVGNISAPVISAMNFIVNNVPQVLGSALYYDFGNDGVNDGDQIVIPFDKPVELNATVAGDAFFVPVLGDVIGPFSTMKLGASNNTIEITINDVIGSNFHLHIAGQFDATKTLRTAPSGLDILDNIPGDIIFAPDTGRTAEPVGDGIDIAPTFNQHLSPSGIAAASTVAVALGFFNNNLSLDAIVINTTGVQSVYDGNGAGDGTFSAIGVQALGNATNTSVAVGDVNGDDTVDIIVGNTGANIVYTNNGSGTFSLVQSLGSSTTQAVALGDIDGINGLDLVTGNNGANRVWRNNGSGVFSEDGTPQTLGANDTRGIALGDINGDGDLDLVTANFGQANRVYTNNGSGTFADSGQALGNVDSYSIALGDVDGDGDLDMVVGNESGQPNQLYLNNGAGVFTDSAQNLGSNLTISIALMDFDGDDDLDIIAGNNSQPNRVWFNDGAGIFADSGQLIQEPGPVRVTTDIALGDLDQDGDLDLLEGRDLVGDFVWVNSTRIKVDFVDSTQQLGNNDTRGIAVGDLNGDGYLDIFTANLDQANRVWFGDADAQYIDSNQELGSNASSAVVLGDIDNDGDLDAIVGNKNQANKVWRNNGAGVFTAVQDLGTFNTEALMLGDIDGDLDLDLIVGNASSTINRVYRNNAGVFSEDMAQVDLGAAMNSTFAVVLGDINGDLIPDLVTGNSGQSNEIFLNNGAGIFVDANQPFSNSFLTRSLALGDVNGDGDTDILIGNIGGTNQVWINPGLIIWDLTLGGNLTTAIALVDVENDGDLDILSSNVGQENRISLNRGNGNFALPQPIAGAETFSTTSMAIADVDGDGDLDFITGNSGIESNRIWLNDN